MKGGSKELSVQVTAGHFWSLDDEGGATAMLEFGPSPEGPREPCKLFRQKITWLDVQWPPAIMAAP